MALSAAFKQSIKERRRRARRLEAVLFISILLLGLLSAGVPFRWENLVVLVPPYLLVLLTFRRWRSLGLIRVNSLDDRAMLEYGVTFDKLDDAQEKEILRRYRVGTYLMNYFPDERETELMREAHVRAFDVMKVLLPTVAAIYWAGWKLLPAGRIRTGWTDFPVVLFWLFLMMLGLPQVVHLWSAPDDEDLRELQPEISEKVYQMRKKGA